MFPQNTPLLLSVCQQRPCQGCVSLARVNTHGAPNIAEAALLLLSPSARELSLVRRLTLAFLATTSPTGRAGSEPVAGPEWGQPIRGGKLSSYTRGEWSIQRLTFSICVYTLHGCRPSSLGTYSIYVAIGTVLQYTPYGQMHAV